MKVPMGLPHESESAVPESRPWLMLGVALLCQVTISIITQGVPTLAPFIQADLGISLGDVGLFSSAITAGSMVALTMAGWAVDTYGERVVLVTGNVAVGLLCLAVAATSKINAALAVLFLAGVGAAGPTPSGSKTVMLWFQPAQRGLAMGVRQTGIPVGGAVAAATLPTLALLAGWRQAVAAGGAACLVAAVVCWTVYRRPDGATGPRGRASGVGARKASLGLKEVLTRNVLLLGLAGTVLPLGQFCLVTYLALYLKDTNGIPVIVTTGLLVGAQVAGAAGRVIWGSLSDRIFGRRRRPPLLWANYLAASGAVMLGWIPKGVPVWLIGILVIAFAFCAIGWHGNWIALLSELSGPEQQGRTIGVAMTIMYIGTMAGPPLFGYLVDHLHSWTLAWNLLGVTLALGASLILCVREGREA